MPAQQEKDKRPAPAPTCPEDGGQHADSQQRPTDRRKPHTGPRC